MISTNCNRRNAQARRLDGKPWECLAGHPKAWPIGLLEARQHPKMALCEGGGDFLAAFHFLYAEAREDDVAPIAMLGAAFRIHDEALPHFRGKRVCIYPHLDSAGDAAAARWTEQLETVGSYVDCYSLRGLRQTNGSVVEDLNDLTSLHPDDFETNHELRSLFP